jgi:hypothetical protein
LAGAVTGNETARDDPRERAWQVRVLVWQVHVLVWQMRGRRVAGARRLAGMLPSLLAFCMCHVLLELCLVVSVGEHTCLRVVQACECLVGACACLHSHVLRFDAHVKVHVKVAHMYLMREGYEHDTHDTPAYCNTHSMEGYHHATRSRPRMPTF